MLPEPASKPWRSRGYLPHFDRPLLVQSLTFRLYDAVPDAVVQSWKAELAWIENLRPRTHGSSSYASVIARYEDAGHGCLLACDGAHRGPGGGCSAAFRRSALPADCVVHHAQSCARVDRDGGGLASCRRVCTPGSPTRRMWPTRSWGAQAISGSGSITTGSFAMSGTLECRRIYRAEPGEGGVGRVAWGVAVEQCVGGEE